MKINVRLVAGTGKLRLARKLQKCWSGLVFEGVCLIQNCRSRVSAYSKMGAYLKAGDYSNFYGIFVLP